MLPTQPEDRGCWPLQNAQTHQDGIFAFRVPDSGIQLAEGTLSLNDRTRRKPRVLRRRRTGGFWDLRAVVFATLRKEY